MYKGSDVVREKNPREGANIFSLLTFTFAFNIFKKSTSTGLAENDLYNVINNTEASRLGDRFEQEWKVEKKMPHPSLSRIIWKIFGKEYLLYGILLLIGRTSVMFLQPLSMGRIVAYFSPDSGMTLSDAVFYGCVIVFVSLFNGVCFHFYAFNVSAIGLRLKVSLCSLMYRKCLKLTAASLSKITNGKIITMMSKDIHTFDMAMLFGHDLWTGIIQIAIVMYLLYQQVGASTFIGIGFLFLMWPLQMWLGVVAKNLRLKTAARTDTRLRRIQEILTSIKLIKLYTWEPYFTNVVNNFRSLEMRKLRQIFWLRSLVFGLGTLSYRLALFLCIISYSLFGNHLNAEKAFVVVGYFMSLFFVCVVAMPMSVTYFAEAKSAIKRIKHYLLVDEIINSESDGQNEGKICIKNVTVRYLDEDVLHDLTVEIQAPSLVGVTGDVASGKSSLLKTIMQELVVLKGTVDVIGEYSYASQEPWLFPATLRENILFGRPFNPERYNTVLKVCALAKDVESFPDKDRTIIVDKGLNLSKGQQMRIALARTIYKECDIYLLDDILSSLDAKVSKFVFEECIQGFLKNKLRILITHNINFLSKTDKVIVLNKGTIVDEGTVEDLSKRNVNLEAYTNIDSGLSSDGTAIVKSPNKDEEAEEDAVLLVARGKGDAMVHIYGENMNEGKVSWKTYKAYYNYAGGWKVIPILLLLCFGVQSMSVYFDYYLTIWVKIEEKITATQQNLTENPDDFGLMSQLEEQDAEKSQAMLIYNAIIFGYALAYIVQLLSFFGQATRTSRLFHNAVFNKIMGATMQFFDTYRSGNILNRMSKDMGVVDEQLPSTYFETIISIFMVIVVLIAVVSTSYIFGLPALILLLFLLASRNYYLKTSRVLKRLEGVTRAPVIGYLNTTLEGLTTIRAAGNQDILVKQFDHHQDLNTSAAYMFLSVFRTYAFWLDVMCNLFTVFIIGTFLLLQGKIEISAANVGLGLSQSISLSFILKWATSQWSEVENISTSVERVAEYLEAEQEVLSGKKPPVDWPQQGKIQFDNVSLKYSNASIFTIKNVSFTVEPKQKVGIIGRTGAGKSSIISALFRLYDVEGTIKIDDLDIKEIDLVALRSKMSIIPQEPVMFEGTIRTNLDPNSRHSDDELWRVLDDINLKPIVENLKGGLEFTVESGGSNFSIGQRQLLCLGRAILLKNNILILDEATANIDPKTDGIIQEIVKRSFVDCTVLTIAHRINTVINSDKIMVVDSGEIVEFEDPKLLLSRRDGIFYNLAKQSGLV